MRLIFPLTIATLTLLPRASAQEIRFREVDIAVYGGTASGVIAAVAAAREGKSVVLLEPGKHLGGMVSGGLGATDVGNAKAIGGYSREFFDRVKAYYVRRYGENSQQVKDCNGGFRFEPHVAERIFREMIQQANVSVMYEQTLVQIAMKGPKIELVRSFAHRDGPLMFAKVYIDASYEGDLLAKAKVSYHVGREGSDKYNESIAGVQKLSPAHQWPVKVSPFAGGKALLPLIQAEPAGAPGSGDRKLQAYNYRLCMTQDPKQRLPFPKPANYDPARFELLARYLEKRPDVKVGQLMNPVKVPNAKTDTNNNGPFSTDHIGANWDYLDESVRDKIRRDHIDYQQGFLYYLANDPRVPAALHREINSWGLAKGEFEDSNGWPHQLYVREARRMLGTYVMTQDDIMEHRTKEDSVGLGSYNTDSHHVQRVVGDDGFVINEGDFQVRVSPYAIPYRSLVPKAKECVNLLVPVCMSASHVAYGTVRMEPVYMILGQASGVAAALAIEDRCDVQKVGIEKLQAKLKAQKAVLSPEGIAPKALVDVRRIDSKKLAGVVVDDEQAEKTGAWVHSTSAGPFVDGGYLHDNHEEQGKRKVRYTPKLPKAGTYELRLFFSPHSNRATNALVVVHHAGGEQMIRVNQRQTHEEKGYRIGAFRFVQGDAWLEIRNDGADGYVIADAVQWVAQ